MREPSASQLALASVCAHPWTSGTRWPEDHGTAGEFGTRVHRGCEALVTGEAVFPELFAGLPDHEVRLLLGCVAQARSLVESETPVRATAELRLRYHVETARVHIPRPGQWREPGEWTAIIDYCAELGGGRLLVRDWKTGLQKDVAPAERNMQMRLCAVAAARAFGARKVRVELAYLSEHDVEVDGAEFGAFDLVAIEHELRALRRSLTGGPTPPVPGTHCTTGWCRLRGICPATRAALASIYPLEDAFATLPRDEAHAKWMLERLPGARAAFEAVQEGLEEFARHTPVRLANGNLYGNREKARRTVYVDTPEQREALEQVLGEHGAGAVRVAYRSSIEAIEAAAGAKLAAEGRRRGKGALAIEALAALEKVGGLKKSTYWAVEEYAVKAS